MLKLCVFVCVCVCFFFNIILLGPGGAVESFALPFPPIVL